MRQLARASIRGILVTVASASPDRRVAPSPLRVRVCRLLAQVCDLRAGELIHVIGDAHVYSNHVEPLKEQLARTPRPFPTLTIDPAVTDIEAIRFEHLTIEGYDPWPAIKMEMAV